MSITEEIMATNLYSDRHIRHQHEFARVFIRRAMLGIDNLTNLPVHILNRETLLRSVQGIDYPEVADLVMLMCTTRSFSLYAIPIPSHNTISIKTAFNRNPNTKRAFGVKVVNGFSDSRISTVIRN